MSLGLIIYGIVLSVGVTHYIRIWENPCPVFTNITMILICIICRLVQDYKIMKWLFNKIAGSKNLKFDPSGKSL